MEEKRSTYSFFYRNPWIHGTDRLAYTFFANHSKGDNRLILTENEKNLNIGIAFSKGFGPYVYSAISMNYNKKSFGNTNLEHLSVTNKSTNEIFEYSNWYRL